MSGFWLDPSSTSILHVCEQRRLWRDRTNAQACPSLHRLHMWYVPWSHELAHFDVFSNFSQSITMNIFSVPKSQPIKFAVNNHFVQSNILTYFTVVPGPATRTSTNEGTRPVLAGATIFTTINTALINIWNIRGGFPLFVCLCWGLTSQSTIFQSCWDGAIASWVINQYFRGVKCLAQGHNTAAIGFEPPTSRSWVRRGFPLILSYDHMLHNPWLLVDNIMMPSVTMSCWFYLSCTLSQIALFYQQMQPT